MKYFQEGVTYEHTADKNGPVEVRICVRTDSRGYVYGIRQGQRPEDAIAFALDDNTGTRYWINYWKPVNERHEPEDWS